MAGKKKYYVVFSIKKLKKILVTSYDEVLKIVKKRGYTCKGFKTKEEALNFDPFKIPLNIGELKYLNENGIYFDMGTGRDIGSEIRVTNYLGESLLYELENYKLLINEFGNLNLGNNKDTQYGELYGLYLALLIAKQNKNNNSYSFISGDNMFAIECSLGKYNNKKFEPYKLDLIKAIIELRKELEKKYKICHIPGKKNPADLGFHR